LINIPRNVETLGFECFYKCKSLSIDFDCASKLIHIEDRVFANSSLGSIIIPRSVEILGFGCFYKCKNLPFLSFEICDNPLRIGESHTVSRLGRSLDEKAKRRFKSVLDEKAKRILRGEE
jgi:hypothetical protein